jgi:hypothetical protein
LDQPFTRLLFGPWFYMASNVAPGSSMVVAPFFISLGKMFNAPALTSFATWLISTVGTWWFYVFYCTFAAVVIALGMQFYAKVQRYSFYIGMLAIFTWVLMLLFTSSAGFQAAFNGFMQNTMGWGNGEAFQTVLQMAKDNGYAAVPLSQTSAASSFLIGPALAYTFHVHCMDRNARG